MQPKRLSVLSILRKIGEALFLTKRLFMALPVCHHVQDEVIIKNLFERLSETAYALYYLLKAQVQEFRM